MSRNDERLETLRELLDRYVSEDTYSFHEFKRLEVNSVGQEKETPLHMACTRDALQDVKILVDGGADVNAQTDIGTTPLMRATYERNFEMIGFLLDHGANPFLSDIFDATALSIAKSYPDADEIVKLLNSTMQKH